MTNKTTTTHIFKNMRTFLHFGHWEFAPSLIPTLAVFILIPLLLSLGFWQLHRAVTKQQLLDQFSQRSKQSPQSLAENEPVYTPVKVSGYYDPAHAILLDNRIVNHQLGYDVLIPFIVNDKKPALLLNLGWIAKSKCESAATCVNILNTLPQGRAEIIGLAVTPEHNFVLAHPKLAIHWPFIIEDIQFKELAQLLNRPLYSFTLLLPASNGFVAHWNIITTITPARHRGYAVQWFALALTLLILYFKLNIRRVG